MNIVLIGPVYPYKGGIAHYTGLMCKSLRKEHEVTMLSYERQYPKILFRREQRDYKNDTFAVEDTQYLFHTFHPLNWSKTAKWVQAQRADLVIIQWWHPYFTPCYYALLQKLKGQNILFICHNVFPHERFPFCRTLSKMVLKRGNGFIVHSQQDADDLLSFLPDAAYEKSMIPTFNAFKFTGMTKAQARKQLGIEENEKILLFFGFVREYKGLRHLVAAMPEIVRQLAHCRLYIVGDFGSSKDEYMKLISESGVAEHFVIHDEYVPDREIEPFFAACDLVVLPYESATQSGIVQIAYGFDKPVVATNVGGLPEVVPDGKTGYVVPPKDAGALAHAVVRFYVENKSDEFAANVHSEADKYSWDRMNEAIARLYERFTCHDKK